ncbi:MAG: response regulator [Anaerolineales bacterium]|nr:response regulator [Anaerolineales bacterium]
MAEGEKIRVLIVDDVAETRENIRRLLQFENDVEVVGAANSGRTGVEAAKELKPDVVIMDINMPDMDGIMATELIRKANPSTQIVILSVQGDPNYMRRAMLAGARDFITKPPAVDELTAAIRRAGLMAHEEKAKTALQQPIPGHPSARFAAPVSKGHIIVVYSPKGGTGTTTLAVNLAVSLKKDDNSVVIVDGNLQYGDVAVFLNEQIRNSILELAPRADELDADIIEEVLITHASTGVKILGAPPRPEYAENVTGEQFGKVMEFLRSFFTYVVIDASSTLTDVILAAMDISDLVVLITTQDIPSIKSARLYLDLADVLGIERQRILFVMNRFDKRIGIMPEKISESFKHEIVAVIPVEERIVLPSINRGVPFMLGDPSRPISKSVLSLVELIQQRIEATQGAEEAVAIRR